MTEGKTEGDKEGAEKMVSEGRVRGEKEEGRVEMRGEMVYMPEGEMYVRDGMETGNCVSEGRMHPTPSLKSEGRDFIVLAQVSLLLCLSPQTEKHTGTLHTPPHLCIHHLTALIHTASLLYFTALLFFLTPVKSYWFDPHRFTCGQLRE
ncbi:hypothetical protein E2C01_087716 [Portunus trituberculatus]|uniref:Uncharacterized protein n=1 Tax=Portunus trituberculatus TaxID=210409 RepID=A0A5B7JH83_PORTR|nr:hypothetical protein [Portunus trituberculatus]